MPAFSSSPFILFAIWVALIVCLFALKPADGAPIYIVVSTLAFVVAGVLMSRSKIESLAYGQAETDWQVQMDTLKPIIDVDDDGHLYDWLNPPEWEAVFAELAKMPANGRSLRAAMGVVSPESRR